VAFVLAALAFKLAAVPAHMWAPDVYQGASLPVTAFLATGSKCAAFAAVLRLLFDAFLPLQPYWAPLLLIVAGPTVVWGSFGALKQTDLRRLMGYSSVTHTGYLLFAAVSGAALSVTAILFYLVQYVFSTLACFFVMAQLTRNGSGYSIAGLSGLNRRAPWLSWMMAASLLSLTGIPPLSGFLAKYLVLAAVPNYTAFAPLYFVVLGLVLIAVVVSVVYYFGILRAMWSEAQPQAATSEHTTFSSDTTLGGALLACVALIVLLGVYPQPLLGWAERASGSFELKPPAVAEQVAGNALPAIDAAPVDVGAAR
jgi:NADH-quinone oxidoreductase subunit N